MKNTWKGLNLDKVDQSKMWLDNAYAEFEPEAEDNKRVDAMDVCRALDLLDMILNRPEE
jgi:hypothetical protein